MFSGIIAAVGRIERLEAIQGGVRLGVHAPDLDLTDVHLGDSIAHAGVCLTVIERVGDDGWLVDVSNETLSCTTGLSEASRPVNLEKAMCLGDRIGGHLVSGHVDGVGEVVSFAPDGDCRRLVIRVPQTISRYLAYKGSVTVDGVSLTVNRVDEDTIAINLIPHTLAVTTLGGLTPGARVNLEVDLIARYLERLMQGEEDRS